MSAEDTRILRSYVVGHTKGEAALARLEARIAEVEKERDYLAEKLINAVSGQEAAEARIAEKSRPFEYWRELHQSSLRERDMWKSRAEAAEARCEALTAALREIAEKVGVPGWEYSAANAVVIARVALATSEQATEEGAAA